MCGINGILCFRSSAKAVNPYELIRTRDYMTTRGPDDAGAWIAADGLVGLGHRRLAIIDLSSAGAQPMSWEGGRYKIVFNGEIYNYKELREELIREGTEFHSTSDTEVLLALYSRYASSMLQYIRGMYAFAIWDGQAKELFLARDPYGIKPLYYSNDGACFRFASQVKALEASNAVSMNIDPAGLVGFLLWGAVPEPHTIRRSIRALPAGHFLVVKDGCAHEPQRYFDFVSNPVVSRTSVAEALMDSVRAHLVSDVPVGVYLSAGLDSSLLTTLACRILPEPPTTFTLIFDDFADTCLDEGPIARQVASVLGTRHLEQKIHRQEFSNLWPEALKSMDQPSIDGFNTYLVSKTAHEQGLKVVLSGLGGDELFGSYPTFHDVPRWTRLARTADRFPCMHSLWPSFAQFFKNTKPKLPGFLAYGTTLAGAYYLRRGLFLPDELPGIIGPEMAEEGLSLYEPVSDILGCLDSHEAHHGQPPGEIDSWEAVHLMESRHYMLNQLLRDSDWASMAHSLELRVPLVDCYLRDSMAALNFEPARSQGKAALVRQMAPELPEAVLSRRKSGFFVPVVQWLAGNHRERRHRHWGMDSRWLALKVLSAFEVELSPLMRG